MNKIKLSAAILLTSASLGAAAQETRTGYFNDEYLYRFQMNPAMANDHNFIGVLPISDLNIGFQGNLHLTDLIYNVDGRTTTFLNPQIPVSEVMKKIGDNNRIGVGVKVPLFAFGFRGVGGYNTVALNMRTSAAFRIPGSVISLAKEGVANRDYDIRNFGAYANAYVELSLGHSHKITDEWRVGANFKLLFGAANFDARLNKATLSLGEDDWSIVSNGELAANISKFQWKKNDKGLIDGADFNTPSGLSGFGIAFDLGAVYSPAALEDWKFSLAFNDLGFISWSNTELATTGGDKTFNTDKYTFNVDDDAPNSFSNEWDILKDDFEAIYQMEVLGNTGSKTRGIGATLNIGAEYTLPVYRKLTFGLLNTTRIQGPYSWTDFRLSANVAPVKCFSASASLGMGTFGVGFGWLVNVHTTGFNLFLGSDHTLGKLAKQGVPLNSNGTLNFGIDFPF